MAFSFNVQFHDCFTKKAEQFYDGSNHKVNENFISEVF